MADRDSIKSRFPADLHARKAVNGTAARVIQPGPKGMESGKRFGAVCQPEPPEMRPVPTGKPNLLGARVGRFTVVGLSLLEGSGLRWIVRCVCGWYSLRSTKAVRNTANVLDACERCRHVDYLKRSDFYRQLGPEAQREHDETRRAELMKEQVC